MNDELIIKYLRKELSEEESARIFQWLEEDRSNQDFLFAMEELYLASDMKNLVRMAGTNAGWKDLEYRILGVSGKQKAPVKRFRLHQWMKYAAIFLIAFSIPYFIVWLKSDPKTLSAEQLVTVKTGRGERSQVILPDGSKVWLNAGSSLSYYTDIASGRRLSLEGEAYFEVAENKKCPFSVATTLLNVRVLGTKFNLKAFPEDGFVETSLYEGLVSANTPDNRFRQDVILEPGQQLCYSEGGTLTLIQLDHKNDIAWKDGIIYFKKQSLLNIVRSLERNFDVEINIIDENLASEEFTCEFQHTENLRDILEVLRMTGRLQYQVHGNKVELRMN